MPSEAKGKISHRARSLSQVLEYLSTYEAGVKAAIESGGNPPAPAPTADEKK